MSSFKRKTTARDSPSLPGTRVSPASTATINISTGIPSLDDILGGGLPLSCLMTILAPDANSSYGQLVQKYFIAEGLVCGHKVCVIDEDPAGFVRDTLWLPKTSAAFEEESEGVKDKIKIAWRYESMKQFQTTVQESTTDGYCHAFDLSVRVPEDVVEQVMTTGQLQLVDVETLGSSRLDQALQRISKVIEEGGKDSVIRICIPSLGSAEWGDLSSQDILRFLMQLKGILRKNVHACGSISLAAHMCTGGWGGRGWIEKVGWGSDGALTMSAFSGNPSLSTLFPSHHGMVQIHGLPRPHSLVSASDRFSTLRGVSSSGENNLAFKCTRRRLVFETLHLDLDGGVSERRTTPGVGVTERYEVERAKPAAAAVEVALEGVGETKKKKTKKSVGFRSDRPELYDF